MKRWLFLLAMLVASILPMEAQNVAIQGFCSTGGAKVVTQGMNSTSTVQASYPKCQVEVFNTGTTDHATIYSNKGGTPLANPFTANTNASWLFYVSQGTATDIKLSGGTPIAFPAPFTLTDVLQGPGSTAPTSGNGPPSIPCNASNVGQVYSNIANGSLYVCDGTDWLLVNGSGFNPSGPTFSIQAKNTDNTFTSDPSILIDKTQHAVYTPNVNKVFEVAGFPTSGTLSFGDGCQLQDGTSCSGTFHSQIDMATATAADWIYQHAQSCPNGSNSLNLVLCKQAAAKLLLANDTYTAYHPVCGPSNIPVVVTNQVQIKPSLSVEGVGKSKSIIRAGATMEGVVYCNDTTLTMNAEFRNFSVDGGYHGLDTNPVALTAATQSGTITTYTGTIPTGANNALVGLTYDFAGFSNSGNNVSAIISASSTTALVVTNASGVTETGATATGTTEMANWAIELNGFTNSFIDHVDALASGSVGIEALGITNQDAAFYVNDQFLYGIHPIPFSTVAQGVANMVSDGGGNYHVGSLTLNNGGNFYCSLSTVNCAVQVRFVGAGVKQCSVVPVATGTATTRSVASLTLTTPGTNCGPDVGISIEPVSTSQYMFYGSQFVNSTISNVNVTGVTSTATRSAGFTFSSGGNHTFHLHPQDVAVGYFDDGGMSYDHPEADTITDHAFDINGDGDTITALSSYWQAGTSWLPDSYDFYLGFNATNFALLSKVCRIGGQSYGGYYEFVDSSGPDDAAVNVPSGFASINNQYCGPITQTGGLTSTSTTVTMGNTTGMRVNYPVTAPSGIVPGTIITAITPNTSITLSNAATATSSQQITMIGPLPRFSFGAGYASQLAVGSPATVIQQTSPGNAVIFNAQTGVPGHWQASEYTLTDLVSKFSIFSTPPTLTANRSLAYPDGGGNYVVTGFANTFGTGNKQTFVASGTNYGFRLAPVATLPSTTAQGDCTFYDGSGANANHVVCGQTTSNPQPLAWVSDITGTVLTASFTTTAATTDVVTLTGMTSSGHCAQPGATNTSAGAATGTYISVKTSNQITVTHAVTAGMTFDIICTPN